ncbi:hypothetical protein EJ07DRAFT_180874 [Lizonia empirigonia]|nr:hypothetical protein EJ07DRAFT_180874 [Lizonia empirigonia]
MTAYVLSARASNLRKPQTEFGDNGMTTVGAASEPLTSASPDSGDTRGRRSDRDEDGYTGDDSSNGSSKNGKRDRNNYKKKFKCSYEGCGKSYIRERHLDRHELNRDTREWAEKEQQLKKLQDRFVQAINRYVFRTGVKALEGLEEDGAGELLEGRGEDVKSAIMGLFLPLLPPPSFTENCQRFQTSTTSPSSATWWVSRTPIATSGITRPTVLNMMGNIGFEAIRPLLQTPP